MRAMSQHGILHFIFNFLGAQKRFRFAKNTKKSQSTSSILTNIHDLLKLLSCHCFCQLFTLHLLAGITLQVLIFQGLCPRFEQFPNIIFITCLYCKTHKFTLQISCIHLHSHVCCNKDSDKKGMGIPWGLVILLLISDYFYVMMTFIFSKQLVTEKIKLKRTDNRDLL